jgi:hypothetical protein
VARLRSELGPPRSDARRSGRGCAGAASLGHRVTELQVETREGYRRRHVHKEAGIVTRQRRYQTSEDRESIRGCLRSSKETAFTDMREVCVPRVHMLPGDSGRQEPCRQPRLKTAALDTRFLEALRKLIAFSRVMNDGRLDAARECRCLALALPIGRQDHSRGRPVPCRIPNDVSAVRLHCTKG